MAIDDFPEKRVYTLDDSSGLNIYCTLNLEPRQEAPRNIFAPGPLYRPSTAIMTSAMWWTSGAPSSRTGAKRPLRSAG